MSAQAQRRRPRGAREHAAAQAQRVRRARAAANGMSPSAPRSATKSPRVRTASPQARRVITLDSYEESKGEDAEAEVARLEAQLAEARRRAYEKRTGKPAPPRKVQFAESGDWSESWHELAEDRAAQYPEETPPPPADAPAAAPAPAAELSEDGKAFRAALAEKARKLAEEKAERVRGPACATRRDRRGYESNQSRAGANQSRGGGEGGRGAAAGARSGRRNERRGPGNGVWRRAARGTAELDDERRPPVAAPIQVRRLPIRMPRGRNTV